MNARYYAVVTYTFGLDTAPHRTQPRIVGADPSGGPYAPLRVYEAVLNIAGVKQPRTRAPAGNGWTNKVGLITGTG